MSELRDYQREFLQFAIASDVLRFGSFTLKSGRVSPYFFNAGLFATGAQLAALGRYYAAAIVSSGVDFDVLFGPAYKGIPIATATAVQLAAIHERDVAWSFNRKEAKDHGEGGSIVGSALSGQVLMIDDVITAGTATREVLPLISGAGATLAGIVVDLDRQERGQGSLSAIQEIERDHGIDVHAIVRLEDVIAYLHETDSPHLDDVLAYRAEYGV